MYERKHTGKFHCRACNRKVPVEDIEQLMREELHQFYGSPEQVAARLTDAKKNLEENEAALAALQRQIQKVREEMKQTHQLFLDGQITPQGFGEFYKPAEARLNQLLGGLPKLEADVNRLKVNQISVEEVVHEARTLYKEWPKMDTDRKRSIVEMVFDKIEIGERKGENQP